MNILAFDSSTEQLSIALQKGESVFTYCGAGGALASSQLIPQIMRLMAQASLLFSDLKGIAFGAGPGAFTGLRGACAVAQGLGFAAKVPLLPINTLQAMAWPYTLTGQLCVAVLDARMDEVYWAQIDPEARVTQTHLSSPESVVCPANAILIGNALQIYGARLPWPEHRVESAPCASQMLAMATQMLARGEGVAPELATPLYVRNKVAQTMLERAQSKFEQMDADIAGLLKMASEHAWTVDQVRSSRLAGHRVYTEIEPKSRRLIAAAIVLAGVDSSEILNIAVAPSNRRQGVAKAMLQSILQDARLTQKTDVLLEVASHNKPAVAFYLSTGFRVIGQRTSYYADGADALVMKCSL